MAIHKIVILNNGTGSVLFCSYYIHILLFDMLFKYYNIVVGIIHVGPEFCLHANIILLSINYIAIRMDQYVTRQDKVERIESNIIG